MLLLHSSHISLRLTIVIHKNSSSLAQRATFGTQNYYHVSSIFKPDLTTLALTPKVPTIQNKDTVPFRYTPNIQTFIGDVGLEGLFSCAIMAVARCLSEPEFEMDQYLSIFIRDEIITWYTTQHIPQPQDLELQKQVTINVEIVIRRLTSLVKVPGGNLPANQTVIDHISQAVDPLSLAQMDLLWMPWI